MKYVSIMAYLQRLRGFCYQDGEHLLKVPIEGDWDMKHLEESLREAIDIIFDYAQAADQTARLTEKYETPKGAIRRSSGMFNTWQCPDCQKFIGYGNEHCHWCGRMIGWEKKAAKTQRKRRNGE